MPRLLLQVIDPIRFTRKYFKLNFIFIKYMNQHIRGMVILTLIGVLCVCGCTGTAPQAPTPTGESRGIRQVTTIAPTAPTTETKIPASVTINSVTYKSRPIAKDQCGYYLFYIEASGTITGAPETTIFNIGTNPSVASLITEKEDKIEVSGWTAIDINSKISRYQRDAGSPESTTWKATFNDFDIREDEFDGYSNVIVVSATVSKPDPDPRYRGYSEWTEVDNKVLVIPHPNNSNKCNY